jgi:hypothetical protein
MDGFESPSHHVWLVSNVLVVGSGIQRSLDRDGGSWKLAVNSNNNIPIYRPAGAAVGTHKSFIHLYAPG